MPDLILQTTVHFSLILHSQENLDEFQKDKKNTPVPVDWADRGAGGAHRSCLGLNVSHCLRDSKPAACESAQLIGSLVRPVPY